MHALKNMECHIQQIIFQFEKKKLIYNMLSYFILKFLAYFKHAIYIHKKKIIKII